MSNNLNPARTFTDAETFLTEAELAALLKVSPRTLQRWRVEGNGPKFRRHGRRVRYSRSDVIAWSDATTALSTSQVNAPRGAE
jgi:excisionase family DNA binding protein